MIIFEIRDKAEKERLLGYLFYYKRSRRFFTELRSELDEWSAPFIFAGLVRRGIYSIDSVWSGKFVAQRIIPPDRQNLGNILRENGLKTYDELKLLLLSNGRCAQDELYLIRKKAEDILPEIRERLEKKVLDVMSLGSFRTLVFFRDGKSRVANIKTLCGEDRSFGNILGSEENFRNVRVSPGGNGIEWGEERFISAERLRDEGNDADISYDDIKHFIRDRLADTGETSGMLGCTRQYVKQLADRGRIAPAREWANQSVFMKGELEAERDARAVTT